MDDDTAMALALKEAEAALAEGEVPVGAVVIADGDVIGRAHNRMVATGDPTAHAELLAIREACHNKEGRLEKATLYSTLEPCPMCAGAIVLARIERVVYGCDDPKAGAVKSLYTMLSDGRLNHRCRVRGGVLETKAAELLARFFEGLRGSKGFDRER